MIINLPHVKSINTLALPKDFEERVKESFAKFTEGTNKDYTHVDKLSYLDKLRKRYIHGFHSTEPETAVKDLILGREEWQLDEYGNLPDRDEYWSMEFFEACYEKGLNVNFRIGEVENSSSRNNETMRVIAEIIKIIMNWEK